MKAQDLQELHGYYFEDLEVGMSALSARTVTEADIATFAGVSGDMNPLHVNREFAATTRWEVPIAHGMLTASLISCLVGMRLPGPGCVWMSQSLKWLKPVRPGDTVYARATIEELIPEKRRARLRTTCHVRDELVLDGEALTMVPSRGA